MGVFDNNTTGSPAMSGEYITADLLHDILERRCVQDKVKPEDKWNAVLWRIYEYVQYDQGYENKLKYYPYALGIKQVYNPDTWVADPIWVRFVDYFHDRGFDVRYDSLNDRIIISW